MHSPFNKLPNKALILQSLQKRDIVSEGTSATPLESEDDIEEIFNFNSSSSRTSFMFTILVKVKDGRFIFSAGSIELPSETIMSSWTGVSSSLLDLTELIESNREKMGD